MKTMLNSWRALDILLFGSLLLHSLNGLETSGSLAAIKGYDGALYQKFSPKLGQKYLSSEQEATFMQIYKEILSYIEAHTGDVLPSDMFLNTPELIHKHGYPNETHKILTADGYILTYHRIPHGKVVPPPGSRRIPVLIQHGIFSESTHWLTQPEFNCLPYILSDAGYDVWLGNARGNRYSRENVRYTTQDWQFWLTEWHEMGLYDIPASIDYILENTGYTKLNYIAHSMGTSMFFVMMSMKPEYNEKVNYMVSFAPPLYMTHVLSPVRYVAPIFGIGGMQVILDRAGLGEFFPHDLFRLLETWYGPTCAMVPLDYKCAAILFTIVGFDFQLMNMTHLPVILATFPSSNPTAAMIHYLQEMICAKPCFKQIDYGAVHNIAIYGSVSPPEYSFARVTVPKTFFYGENDWLASRTDIELTIGLIPNTNYTLMPFPKWNHMDYMWAENAHIVLHPQVVQLFKSHDSGFA